MSRYRLRFLLQELDLHGPEVVIGRSPECQISIEDPLVSRQHARITITPEGAQVTDLGSRNGVRVNGSLIHGETLLRHNDRLRLGTQDLVFLVIEQSAARLTRATGFMTHCKACSRPFPGEAAACPHCGEPAPSDQDSNTYDTITGVPGLQGQAAWTFQLLGEVIERALQTGRKSEAERMLQRAASEIEQRGHLGVNVDPKHLAKVAVFALRLARAKGQPGWAEWAIALHRDHAVLPSVEMIDQLETLEPPLVEALRPLLSGFFLWWTSSRAEAADEQERGLRTRVAALTNQA